MHQPFVEKWDDRREASVSWRRKWKRQLVVLRFSSSSESDGSLLENRHCISIVGYSWRELSALSCWLQRVVTSYCASISCPVRASDLATERKTTHHTHLAAMEFSTFVNHDVFRRNPTTWHSLRREIYMHLLLSLRHLCFFPISSRSLNTRRQRQQVSHTWGKTTS